MRYIVVLIVLVLIPTILCCQSDDDCNNHGVCKNDECVCDVLYYAPNCTFWADEISEAYTYWFYPYTVLNFGFFVASLVKFYQLAKATGFSRLRREFSVRHLSILMMVLGLLARVINTFILIDGKDWERSSRGFLPIFFFIFFPFVIVSYTCELLIWLELYTTTTLHNIERLPRFRKILLIINALVFPVEISLRAATAILRTGPTVTAFYFTWAAFICLLVLVESIGFLVLSLLLMVKVRNMKSVTAQEQQHAAFVKLTGTLIAQTVMVMLTSLVLAGASASFNTKPGLFLAVNIVARLVEFGGIVFIMVVVKPQERGRVTMTTSHSSGSGSHPMTDIETLKRTISNESSTSYSARGMEEEEKGTSTNFVDLSVSSEMVSEY